MSARQAVSAKNMEFVASIRDAGLAALRSGQRNVANTHFRRAGFAALVIEARRD